MPPHTVVDPIIFPKSFPLSESIPLPCDFVVAPTQRAECTSHPFDFVFGHVTCLDVNEGQVKEQVLNLGLQKPCMFSTCSLVIQPHKKATAQAGPLVRGVG